MRYAPGLDGIRALAVAAVVCYHLGTTGAGFHPLPGGFLGVDVFFVLSGYLITTLLVVEVRQTGRISIIGFYGRRMRRLFPALFALLLVVAIAGAYWLPDQAGKLRGDLLASIGYATNWWLIFEESSYFASDERPRLLTHLWSLAVEEQFYLVWPFVMLAFAKVRARRTLMVTVLAAGVIASTAAAWLLYDPWTDPSRVYYGTDTRALAPLLGAALAVAVRPWRYRERLRAAKRVPLDVAGFLALAGLAAIAAVLADSDRLLYQGGFLAIALLGAVLVAAAGHPATWLGRALGVAPLRWLGERSYALYLWHWPICALTRPGVDIQLTGWANTALRVGLAVVLADLSYRLVERPFRRTRKTRRQRARLAVAAYAAIVAASVVGVQFAVAAARPVAVPQLDAGPAATLGPLDTESATGLAARPTSQPTKRPTPAPGKPNVVVFGDSQGMTLMLNKPADLGQYLNVTDATIGGCGVLTVRVASRSGERRDLIANCPNWKREWEADAVRLKPRIALVILGAWDVFDFTLRDGRVLKFGSPEWEAHLGTAVRDAIAILKRAKAHVALALLPCYRPIRGSAGHWPERGDDWRTRRVNTLFRSIAAADPASVTAVEPPGAFCTDPAIATDTAYRWDGVHYFRPGAALYFKTVIPQLLKMA